MRGKQLETLFLLLCQNYTRQPQGCGTRAEDVVGIECSPGIHKALSASIAPKDWGGGIVTDEGRVGTQSLLAPSRMTFPNVLYYLRGEKKTGLGLLPTHSLWEDVSMETRLQG